MNTQEIQIIQGKLCFTSAISQVLSNNGIYVSEELIYGLGFGLDFRMYLDKKGSCSTFDCVNLVTDYKKIEGFLNDLGIKIREYICDESDMFQSLICEKVNNSCLIAIDAYYLPYSNTYRKKHDAHIVVATYMSDEIIILQDTYVSALIPRKQIYIASLSELLLWTKIVEKDIARYYIWKFRMPDSSINISREYCFERMEQLINNYLVLESKDSSVVIGLNGLYRLYELFDSFSVTNMSDTKKLIFLHERISANGGLFQTRILYSSFLNEKIFQNIPLLQEFSKELENVAYQWKNISALLLKSSLKRNTPKWEKINKKVKENIIKEREIVEKVYKMIIFKGEKNE